MITNFIHSKKFKKVLIASLAIALVAVIVFTSYAAPVGDVYNQSVTYISEVEIFTSDTLSKAIKKCEEKGFIPVKQNLNHSNNGDLSENGIYVIGYKTTDNPDDSITGLSMLQMNSGYQDYTYGFIAERAVEKLGNIPTELSYAVNEFVENYKNGSPAAKIAVDTLNCYYIDEMNNLKLGDYMVSGQCTVDFLKKLLARSSTAVVTAVCNALVAGVAEYGNENWATRLCSSSIPQELEDDANFRQLDIKYKPIALELVEGLQNFAKAYHDAEQRYYENNKKIEVPDFEDQSKTEMPQEIADDMANGGEIQFEDGDILYLYAYTILNEFDFNSSTKLGDYIVSLGDSTYDDIASLRKLYPLVDSLTNGQAATMRISGVALTVIYLKNGDGLISKSNEQLSVIKKDIKSKTGIEAMSIWTGTDQTIYNQKVALTTEASRANSAGQIYNTLTSPDKIDEILSEAMSKIEIIMSVIGLGYGITMLVGSTIGYLSAFAIGSVGVSASLWAVCCAGIGSSVLGTLFGVLGCAFIILQYVALVAMIVILVAILVKYLYDLFTDDDDEEFTPIPAVVFDSVNNRYVKYEVIKCDDNAANINGDNARRWNALYYSKSSYVGDPICSSDIEDLITVQYNNDSTPLGYVPVKNFGEVTAANLNANSKSDSASVYMFCKSTLNDINEGTEQDGGTYLSKISLSVEDTETAAKAKLTKSGLHVLDVNLSPVVKYEKKYAYLGFSTTTNPDDAITDIRIAPRNSTGVYIYGSASYTACGSLTTGDTLYYTSYKSAGSPILADLKVAYSYDEAPEGYEPINMFCGGDAYNFNVGSEVNNKFDEKAKTYSTSYEHWNDKKIYIYFKPSVMYTQGTEYISGLFLVAGRKVGKMHSADDLIKENNFKKFDVNLTRGWKADSSYNVYGIEYKQYTTGIDTYLCYTTTYNPYRAIYGIRSYTSEPGNYSVAPFLGNMNTGAYAVCDVMFELPYVTSNKIEDFYRGIYDTHSYQFAPFSGDMTGIRQENIYTRLAPEDYETVDWSYTYGRGKGLYVLGPTKDGTPLTLNDIIISSDEKIPDGFASVQDFKTPNRTEPHNLGYCVSDNNFTSEPFEPVYIYQRQSKPVEKKYISSISVTSFDYESATGQKESSLDSEIKNKLKNTSDDYCIQSLINSCTDEIVQANLSVDYSNSIYADCNKQTDMVSYIGVSRTDSQAKAITGIIRYCPKDINNAPSTISVGGVTYYKAGDMIKDAQSEPYYLYYTYSSASNPGKPITSISVSSVVFESNCATSLTTNSYDISELKEGDTVSREGHQAELYGEPASSTFIHMAYVDTATIMEAIYVGHGKTKKEAQCNLLSLGCNMCIDLDLNKDANGEYVYIGYTMYTMTSREKKKNDPNYAVRDIVLTVGEDHQKKIIVNGIEYYSAIDEYTMAKDYDGTKAVSLNAGTGGKAIYIYYTTTKTNDTTEPISRLGASCKDYAMTDSSITNWECITDKNGNRVNVNDGALKYKDDGKHIVDNRIYLYASRNDTVKENAVVAKNYVDNNFISYDVYMKGV